MTVIRAAECRRTETPNAIMTTLASPGQGSAGLPIWRVDMAPERSGPLHGIDAEQVWTVLEGSATVVLGTGTIEAGVGDTLVLPPDVPRRITAGVHGMSAIVVAPAGMRAYPLDGTIPAVTCAVPDGDKLIPAWTV